MPTLEVIYEYANEKKLDMPIVGWDKLLNSFKNKNLIFRVIHGVVHGKLSKEEASERLMTRDLKDEFDFV